MEDLSSNSDYRCLDGVYTAAYYIKKDEGEDSYSYKLYGFKTHNFYSSKFKVIAYEDISSLNIKFDYIIRVLGHEETDYEDGDPMDTVGKYLSKKLGIPYVPNSILKTEVTRALKGLGKRDRKAEIKDKYGISDNSVLVDGCKILIIDEITTTGATICELAKVLKAKYPNCEIYLYAFGKTVADADANSDFDMDRLK